MNVVWLASWFPNRTNITNGDFIERHAKSVAPLVESLSIIAVIKDDQLPFNAVEIQEQKLANITTYIVYYGLSKWGGALERILSLRKYVSLHKKIVDKIISETGRPDLVHVNVAMKAGLVARKIKQQYNIPYIVTEHWTAYYKQARPNVFEMGNYFCRLTRAILKEAALLLTVSDELGKAINDGLINVHYQVLPNVVDTAVFYPAQKNDEEVLKLVHVSSMEYQKNVEAIIVALSMWKQQGGKFVMQLYGPLKQHLLQLVTSQGLENDVFFKGEVLQQELAPAVQQADALILYSRYETFGCVLIEANACGVPVIVSNLPVFHEFITERLNGIFVEDDNPEKLAAALIEFTNTKNSFDKAAIAKSTKERFGFDTVGRQLKNIYSTVVNNKL
ncbi:MAG: glycosyltransferase [Chitinophagaceae bacterium]|nr:glycosyltransferase [Chitinophagaceae bacterium]